MNKDVQQVVRRLTKQGFRIEHRGVKQGTLVLLAPTGDSITVSSANDCKRIERWAERNSRAVEALGGPLVVEAKPIRNERDSGMHAQGNVARNTRNRSLRAFDRIEAEASHLLPDDRARLLSKLGWA